MANFFSVSCSVFGCMANQFLYRWGVLKSDMVANRQPIAEKWHTPNAALLVPWMSSPYVPAPHELLSQPTG